MRSRIVLILIGLTVLWAVMIGRAGYLQLVSDVRLQSLQKRQFKTVVTLSARRGDVLDRNEHELAVSMTSYSLFADPKIIEEPKKVARMLSKELKIPYRQVEEKLHNRKKRFVWIERHIEKHIRDTIAEQKIRGLGFIEESKRIYPNERLLSHVLGFVGSEGKGIEGLELKYNEALEAAKRKVSLQRDARGRPLIVNGQIFNQVPDGADVVLTIDREIQFILEQELAQAVSRHQADSAVGVVLDAQTSEVLAMASSPSFDPNRADKFSADRRRNRVIVDSFEPGSVMKSFVVAGALSRGLVQPETRIDTEGGMLRIGKRVIREADAKHRFQSLTVKEILQYSSNVGATKIAFKMGSDAVRESLERFGFGEKTGIDLPGEAKGIMQSGPWKGHLLANISFGHGITATALQVANGYAAIANGGVLHQPYVVKEIRDHENGEVIVTQPKTIRRVLTEEQVAKMKKMLLAVTSKEGTGYNARVPGFPVAGKTGTAQKVNPNGRGYLRGGYISSFAGFIPADHPKFVIYVVVDHPRKEYYGSAVAAPIFSHVAKFAVRKAGLAPTLMEENVVPLAKHEVAPVVRDEIPGDMEASDTLASNLGFVTSLFSSRESAQAGSESKSFDATTAHNQLSSLSGNLEEEAETASSSGPPIGEVVPDLKGLTLREVLSRVSGTGIKVQVKGEGFVTHSIPAMGSKLSDGKLTVFLSNPQ